MCVGKGGGGRGDGGGHHSSGLEVGNIGGGRNPKHCLQGPKYQAELVYCCIPDPNGYDDSTRM